ncbi:MAG: secondary thiamine-phosphate synthase enzyme YjbQ [Desulfoferrobacter sp.]
MKPMIVHCDSLTISLSTGPDIVNITSELRAILKKSGVEQGSMQITIVGSTGSITTIEYEPGVVNDLKNAIERLAPPDLDYEHEKAWHDGNGHSHVQAALMGPSLVLPVRRGELVLGTWQQAVVINHDNRPRKRRVEVTIIGSTTS